VSTAPRCDADCRQPEQHQPAGFGLGHGGSPFTGQRERGFERPLAGDVGADAKPVGCQVIATEQYICKIAIVGTISPQRLKGGAPQRLETTVKGSVLAGGVESFSLLPCVSGALAARAGLAH
jgi:hypothetical protein